MTIPAAIWEDSFTLFGVQVRCYLDDERRIINAEDVYRLLVAIETQDMPLEDDLTVFAR